jgi:uncharacterized heparinase superfamily protein
MARGRFAERAAFAWLATRTGGRQAVAHLDARLWGRWRWRIATTDTLLIAPPDIRTADPTLATQIYAGRFTLAGKVVDAGTSSPFHLTAPSPAFARELHGFGWLRHLRAAESAITRANARALVDDWTRKGFRRSPALDPAVTARRLISWFSHATLILTDAEDAFYRRFIRTIGWQVRHLGRDLPALPAGRARIEAAIALTMAGLCLDGQSRLLARAVRLLSAELDLQILPDGCHISRHPGVAIDLLLDLLPLRQSFAVRLEAVPQSVISAIDRMMPMLRFFRHADGTIATLNGMGPTPFDEVATIFAHDETLGEPLSSARHGGYQRLAARDVVVLLDAGRPPPPDFSEHAHAGTLAFEFSATRHRIVVSCGQSLAAPAALQEAARTTAAHSALVVADTSTCRFSGASAGRPPRIIAGPQVVDVDRRDLDDSIVVRARHDGISGQRGLLLERRLMLARDASRLDGEDIVLPARGNTFPSRGPGACSLRFHLHPLVRPIHRPQDGELLLVLPDGETWQFLCDIAPVRLDDSVFLAGTEGPRRTKAIVIESDFREQPSVRWSFQRVGAGRGR